MVIDGRGCCDWYRGNYKGHVGCSTLAFVDYLAACDGRGGECCSLSGRGCCYCIVPSCRNSCGGSPAMHEYFA